MVIFLQESRRKAFQLFRVCVVAYFSVFVSSLTRKPHNKLEQELSIIESYEAQRYIGTCFA